MIFVNVHLSCFVCILLGHHSDADLWPQDFYSLYITGVTTLLEPPDVNIINTTVIGAEDYDHPVTPTDSKRGTDPTSIGFTFTLSTDEAVTRYGNDYIFLNFTIFRLIIFGLPIFVFDGIWALSVTYKCVLYEQSSFIYRSNLPMYALFINGENEATFYRQWFVI